MYNEIAKKTWQSEKEDTAMDKDTILKLSRAENEGKQDEREQSIENKAGVVGRWAGLCVCLLLVLISEYLLHNRDTGRAAWIVFFAMEGCSNLYLYLQNRKTSALVWSVVKLACAVIYLAILVILNVR